MAAINKVKLKCEFPEALTESSSLRQLISAHVIHMQVSLNLLKVEKYCNFHYSNTLTDLSDFFVCVLIYCDLHHRTHGKSDLKSKKTQT